MIPAADYHRIVVLPSLAEFYARNGDLRLAMHAAISLTHAIDYVFQNRGPDPKAAGAAAETYRRDLVGRCYSFGVVEGFAKASKHCTMDRRSLRGFSSSQHDAFTAPTFGNFTFGHFLFNDTVGGISIEWRDDGWVNLTLSLKASCAILETELPELTAPPTAPPPAANAP